MWVDDLNAIHRHTMTQGKLTQRKRTGDQNGASQTALLQVMRRFQHAFVQRIGKDDSGGGAYRQFAGAFNDHGFSPNRC